MKKKSHVTIILLMVVAMNNFVGAQGIVKQQPIIQTKYTADPAPMVHNDTVFLYTSHDEDDAEGFKMLDWLLYTSTDMVNWTGHGAVASLKDFSWARQDNGAWAVQCIERDGKFYLYCPMHGNGIGVLVADSPYGPFKDPLGKRLIETDHLWNDIDPTPFIDDDGQAYLYWGNPDLYYVKLNKDMISVSGEVIKDSTKPQNYQEGPWVWKRNGYYYLAYASTCCPEGIGYAMSSSPSGSWEYKGMIVDASELTRGNHPGIVGYKGNTYCFGHSYDLLKQSTSTFYERRSVDMDQIYYNEDGTITNRHYWSVEGPKQIGVLNPYQRVEAETMAWSEGVKSLKDEVNGVYIVATQNNSFTEVKGVDFKKKGPSKLTVRFGTKSKEAATMEIRLDSQDGDLIGVVEAPFIQGEGKFDLKTIDIDKVTGVHDVFFIFKGKSSNEIMYVDYWLFSK